MRNTIWIGLVVVLIIALVGIYMALAGPKKLGVSLTELAKKLDAEIQRLAAYTPPYVYTGESVGYVIEFENGAKFYFAGDTGITADMKYVVGDFYKPDVAFLPIGNYYTMDPKAAAYAASILNPAKYVVPNHYASFPMLEKDPSGFFAEVAKYNLRAAPLKFEVGVEQEVLGVRTLWLGHGNWFYGSPEGINILVDPEVEYNMAYPEDWRDLTKFEKIDLILLTHGHFDHATIPDLRKWVDLYHPLIIAPYELGIWLKDYLDTPIMPINKGANIASDEVTRMGLPGEKMGGVRVHLVPTTHSSSGTPPGFPVRY